MSVALVGAGPGDPGLITARGLELLRACDVLVYDRLVSEQLVREAPAGALLVPREPLSQEEINQLLVDYGRAGLAVVRLKGGDPYVLGRGGEETLSLAEAGVPYEVVPGVSSLAAVPAAAAIPVTHRGVASQVTLVSGHAPAELDLELLARTKGTIVLFMGLASLEEVASGLIDAGKSPDTPAAVVANGTLPEQEVVVAPLGEIAARASCLEAPALVVLGEVVSLREAILGAAEPVLAASV